VFIQYHARVVDTGRSLQIKFKEHCVDIKHNQIKRSSLAEHSRNIGHLICIENTKINAKMSHYGKIKVCEALEIELNASNINRDEGFKMKEAWRPVIHKIKNKDNSNLE
jgi:hypothetical protein